MQREDFKEQVKVFISSNIDDKYKLIRESLKLLLEKTGMCKVYCFEEEPGSSTEVREAYLYHVGRSDLIVFLIDNKDGINSGTLLEVKRSRDLKKKCIFLFCNEKEKNITELQKEIINSPKGEKYKEVSEFSHMAEEAYKSVLADVVDIYLRYCGNIAGAIENIGESKEKENIELNEKYSMVNKSIYKDLTYIKNILYKYVLNFNNEIEAKDNFNLYAGLLFEVLLGNIKYSSENFEKLTEEIIKLHRGKLKTVINQRLKAMSYYWQGNIEAAIEVLTETMALANKTKVIPRWVVNDIAIDLRNLAYIRDEYNNVICFENDGQKMLDSSEESVYFPVLDRMTSNYYESCFKDYLKELIKSPTTVNIGGVTNVLDNIANVFVLALVYGSITHIYCIRDRLSLYLKYLSLNTRDHRVYCATVKMLLLKGISKDLYNFVNIYGEYTDAINNNDISEWINTVENIPIEYRKLNSKLLLMGAFGYYFSDEQFEDYFADVKAEIRIWTAEQFAGDIIAKEYIKVIKNLQKRISLNDTLEVAYLFRQKNLKRWYNDIFDMLQDISIDEKENLKILKKYIEWLNECLADHEIVEGVNKLPYAIQTIRLQLKDAEELDDKVKNVYPEFFEKIYKLNVLTHEKEELNYYIKKCVGDIVERNNTQGKDGKYSGYMDDPYRTLENIFNDEMEELDNKLVENLCNAVCETLKLETQTIDSKISALELVVILNIMYSNNQIIANMGNQILNEYEEYPIGHKAFFKRAYTKHVQKCIYTLLKVAKKEIDKVKIIEFFAELYDCQNAETILILQFMRRFFSAIEKKEIHIEGKECFLQYLFEGVRNENRNIRCWSYINLMELVSIESEFEEVVLNAICKAMDDETYDIKVSVLSRLKNIQGHEKLVDYIIAKGKVDNHYWVRKIAENSV